MRFFAVFSHTGPVSVHDIGPTSHGNAAERFVAVGRLRILVASIGFVRNHLTQPEVSVYVTYRPISVIKVGADVGLYSSITSSAIDLQTFTGRGLSRNDPSRFAFDRRDLPNDEAISWRVVSCARPTIR